MKVLLVNGSPHAEGSTYTALAEVGTALAAAGVEVEWFYIGNELVRGCAGCGACAKLGRCAFEDDRANELARAIADADGLVLGSPVYYAGPNGALCALLDRAFYSYGKHFAGKPGAAVVVCRRAGATAALDRLNKYFAISRMPQVPSQYWNMAHGNCGDEVRQDAEGLQIMRTLGAEMAFLLKALEGRERPQPEAVKQRTNFIR